MQTFFINTSADRLQTGHCMLDIVTENRELIPLDYPIADWFADEKGYEACVRKIGEMIDSYEELGNEFHVLVYLDLTALPLYQSFLKKQPRSRDACQKALYSLLRSMIRDTLYARLRDNHRTPLQTVIIFKEFARPEDHITPEKFDENAEMLDTIRTIMGIPEQEDLEELAMQSGSFEVFFQGVLTACRANPMLFPLTEYYRRDFDVYYTELQQLDDHEKSYRELLLKIYHASRHENFEVASTSLITHPSVMTNKYADTLEQLRFYYFLTEGIFSDSFLTASNPLTAKPIPDFTPEQLKIAATVLQRKISLYQTQSTAIHNLEETYSKMELVPKLRRFNAKRFGFDDMGDDLTETVVADDEENEALKAGREEDSTSFDETEEPEKPSRKKPKETKKVMKEQRQEINNLLPEKVFPEFDYEGEKYKAPTEKRYTRPDEYLEASKNLRRHHQSFLKKLKLHITQALTNYAVPSLENKPAMLKKSKVNIAEQNFSPQQADRSYSNNEYETRPIEEIGPYADTVLEHAETGFFTYNTARPVSMADIDKQCNWYATRMAELKKTFRRLNIVLFILLAVLVVAYVPYLFIQWREIRETMNSIATGIVSIFLPVILGALSFLFLVWLERREYRKAWEEFQAKIQSALQSNIEAVRAYDHLLKVIIPRYRWVYEYRSDVQFYQECCRTAMILLAHHRIVLSQRIHALRQILRDLAIEPLDDLNYSPEVSEPDLKSVFCSGKENIGFYSVFDRNFYQVMQSKNTVPEEGKGGTG